MKKRNRNLVLNILLVLGFLSLFAASIYIGQCIKHGTDYGTVAYSSAFIVLINALLLDRKLN